jgi:hypothetical protein
MDSHDVVQAAVVFHGSAIKDPTALFPEEWFLIISDTAKIDIHHGRNEDPGHYIEAEGPGDHIRNYADPRTVHVVGA